MAPCRTSPPLSSTFSSRRSASLIRVPNGLNPSLIQAGQNLNEVENLYFHHYGKHQPASQMSFTMRVPVAGTFRSSHPSTNDVGPTGTQSPLPADEDPEAEVELNDSLDVRAHSGPAGPSRPSTTNPTSSQLRQPSSSRDLHTRQMARPNPYPTPGAAASSTSHSNAKSTFPSSFRSGPHPSNVTHSSALRSPTPSHTTPFPTPRSPTKSPGKGRIPPSTYQTPRLTKTQNQNTSTPSTLKPPITDNSTTYKPSPSLTAGMGSGVGSLGSGLAGQSTGPTSYESFWSSLGSGSGLGMTSAAARVGSPSKASDCLGINSSRSSATVDGQEMATSAGARATAHSSSPEGKERGTATPATDEMLDTATPSIVEQPPSSIYLFPEVRRPSLVPPPMSSRGGANSLLGTTGSGGINGLSTNGTASASVTALLLPS